MPMIVGLLTKLFKKTPFYQTLKTALTMYLLGAASTLILGMVGAGLVLFFKNRETALPKLKKLLKKAQ